MKQTNSQAKEIQKITGLEPRHFADLVRTAQLIFDPTGGVSGMRLEVDWHDFGISENVADNLKKFGQKYQYASPHIAIEVVWDQLTPETRSWMIENKDNLWKIEEAFPALDED